MAQLKSPGFFARLASVFAPKRVVPYVRTEMLPNGEVEVTPFFTVDNQDIPAELLGPGTRQKVLGLNVVLDAHAQGLLRNTKGRVTRLAKRQAGEVLLELERAGISVRTKDGGVRVRVEPVKPDVTLTLRSDDSLTVESTLVTPQGIILDKPRNLDDLKADDGWFAIGEDMLRVEMTSTPIDRVLIKEHGNRALSGDDVPRFLKMLGEQSSHVGVVEKNEALQGLSILSMPSELRASVQGNADTITVTPSLVYAGTEGRQYEQTAEELRRFDANRGGFRRVSDGWVDVVPEALSRFGNACQELNRKLGPLNEIRGARIPTTLQSLAGAAGRDKSWSTPWSVYFSQAVKDAHRLIEAPANVAFGLNIVDRDGRSLLALDPMYNHQRFRFSHQEATDAINNNGTWVRRQNAWVEVDLGRYNQVDAGIRKLRLQPSAAGYTFPASQREQVIELFSVLGSIEHSASYAAFVAKLADFEKIEDVPLPAALRDEIRLRPYQKHGYNWLAFLHRFGLNGILADDMGLGKTLQTLAVIQRAREFPDSKLPSLVICPTSVVNNWRSEIEKFFRDCSVLIYAGSNRSAKLRHLLDVDRLASHALASPIVLTSYDIARLDHEKLNRIHWLYVVVDEGHNIKNPDAQRTRAIKTIAGRHKLALTGTPIQNNLEELWSLFDYAMPGYLGNRKAFRDQYGRNGKTDWNAVRGGKRPLKERIHPFVMRRLKKDVEKDLPTKTVVHQQVDLMPLQVKLYKQVAESAEYRQMVESVIQKGVSRSTVQIFAALAKLQAICNHPILAQQEWKGQEVNYTDSGKLDCLKELMEEIVEGEHRALLFSRSTRMLDIIQAQFRKWGVRTMRLDGSTPPSQRLTLVDEFNGNQDIHCFLISTKAGGTGLNLTGADTVIFYDHDWNPANDNQAQDRAYRIGQTKPVTVYKLVSKGTIEEKILERQQIKQTLADEIIGADEQGFKDLTKEELLALFTLDEDTD